MKRTIGKDIIPLIITVILVTISIGATLFADYVLNYKHYVGIGLIGISSILYFKNKKLFIYVFGLTLVLGIFNVIDIYYSNIILGLGSIKFNPIFLTLLIIFLALNRKLIDQLFPEKLDINVREAQLRDVDLIADYWLKSDPDFLVQMGVDLNKLPTRNELRKMLTQQINNSIINKKSYALIWELNKKEIGHTNVNGIEYGKQATMHLHLWNSANRKKGIGTELVKQSLPLYFENLKLKKLFCEPYALNPAPNKTLKKVGFKFIKKHKTIPGSLNFEQEVNRWELTKEDFEKI